MPWTRLDERRDPTRVVQQLHEHGCGAACAVMLLRDRGHEVDQMVVAERLRLPCAGRELATRLNELSPAGVAWVGGELAMPVPADPDGFRPLVDTGSWGAMLIPSGRRHGHWVVVDGLDIHGALVRDPVGCSYRLPFREFTVLMRYMVAVVDVGERP